jgi:preprotein translocase subunit SecE
MAEKTEESRNKALSYVGEVQKEMKKVNWPKRKELVSNTVLTLVAALVLAMFIFASDQMITQVLNLIYR